MLRPALALVAALAVLALPSPASAEPDPMVGAPSVGDCFDVSANQAMELSLHEDRVACRRQHTLETFVVGELPASIDWDSPVEQIHRAVIDACGPARDRILGADLATQYLSLYVYFWFQPTKAEIDAGARWFSCHLGLAGGNRVFPLKEEPSRLTKKGMADSEARCLTKTNRYTACSERHVARAVFASVVDKKPNDRNVNAAVSALCPRHVSTRTWGYSSHALSTRSFVIACYDRNRR